MDGASTVLTDGVVYVRDEAIAAVQPAAAPPPAGLESVHVTNTAGTIYPGLIELHNHLSYNALPLWNVPKKYTNRNQWSGPSTPEYHKLITGPMSVLGRLPEYVNAIVRFVECAACVGTCASHGLA